MWKRKRFFLLIIIIIYQLFKHTSFNFDSIFYILKRVLRVKYYYRKITKLQKIKWDKFLSNKFERAIVKWPTERPGLRIGVIQHKDIIKRHNEPWAIVGKVYKVGLYGKTEHCQILWTGYLDSMKLNIMMSKYLTFYGFKTQLKRVLDGEETQDAKRIKLNFYINEKI